MVMKKINKLDRIIYIISFITILIAGFAISVGLNMIEIGENGIHFLF